MVQVAWVLVFLMSLILVPLLKLFLQKTVQGAGCAQGRQTARGCTRGARSSRLKCMFTVLVFFTVLSSASGARWVLLDAPSNSPATEPATTDAASVICAFEAVSLMLSALRREIHCVRNLVMEYRTEPCPSGLGWYSQGLWQPYSWLADAGGYLCDGPTCVWPYQATSGLNPQAAPFVPGSAEHYVDAHRERQHTLVSSIVESASCVLETLAGRHNLTGAAAVSLGTTIACKRVRQDLLAQDETGTSPQDRLLTRVRCISNAMDAFRHLTASRAAETARMVSTLPALLSTTLAEQFALHDAALKTLLPLSSSSEFEEGTSSAPSCCAVESCCAVADVAEETVTGDADAVHGAYGGSWHSSDDGGSSSCCSSIAAEQQERLEWLCRYWTVSDSSFNARLIESANVEFPRAIGGPVPAQLAAEDGW